ncbi:MAG TPA: MerR family transcriptional regulator [Chitinophagaceae bacterium]|nr:MerR family transcriptional regulator [Chitinophagaceae bacterium]
MAFTIKELETLTGIKTHTIRIWEQRYNFLKPSRTITNIRSYNNEELKTLLSVALLNKYGYKISKIDNMLPEQRSLEVLSLNEAEAKKESIVNELIGCMVDLKPNEFEAILNYQIKKFGLTATLTTVIFQFLNRVGILWQINRINPSHEHIVSNIIRQKIIVATEELPYRSEKDSLLILFLPENEHHELGLLYVYYLVRGRGLQVIYLGANTPLKEIKYVADSKQATHLYLHLTAIPSKLNFEEYIATLSAENKTCKILISGFVANNKYLNRLKNIHPLKSLPEVIEYLNSL